MFTEKAKWEKREVGRLQRLGQKLYSFGVMMESMEHEWNSSDAVTSRDFYRLAEHIANGKNLKGIKDGIAKAIEWGFHDLWHPYSPTWSVAKNDIGLDKILRDVLCLVVWPEKRVEIADYQFNPRLMDLIKLPLDLEELMLGSRRGIILWGIILEIFGLYTDTLQVMSMERYSENARVRLLNRMGYWFKNDGMKRENRSWKFFKNGGCLLDPEMCKSQKGWIFNQIQELYSFKKDVLVNRLDGISLWCYRLVNLLQLDEWLMSN
nr:MAG TPA: hypothetical protein [Caudoviricetes sp.]